MTVIMVSIGRNVGNEPLNDRNWLGFVNGVSDVLRNQGETPEAHFGVGMWQGIREESAHITVYRDTVPDLQVIRLGLARLARMYGQDAIALSVSEPELVTR